MIDLFAIKPGHFILLKGSSQWLEVVGPRQAVAGSIGSVMVIQDLPNGVKGYRWMASLENVVGVR